MTVPYQDPTITLAGTGAQRQFNYPFEVPFQDDGVTPAVVVFVQNTGEGPQQLDPGVYSISGVGNVSGGVVTYPVAGPALPPSWTITIQRALAYTQNSQFANNGGWQPKNIEIMGDRLEMQLQQLLGEDPHTILVPLQTSIATYAALRVYSPIISSFVFVEGGTAESDGGQGWFYLDPNDTTSSDNAGTIIVDSGARWKRLYSGPVYPEWFGAKGDGTTNDSPALQAIVNLGLEMAGRTGAVYGINGAIDLSTALGVNIHDISFVDMSATLSASRKLLSSSAANVIKMHKVTVNRGNLPTRGSFNSAAAIWLAGSKYIDLVDVEVFGQGLGAGIHLVNVQSGVVDRPYIHDLLAGALTDPTPPDGQDMIAGFWPDGCINLTVSNGTVSDLLTQCSTYAAKNINTRAYTGGGPGVNLSMANCTANNVDEGFDQSGDQNLIGWQMTSCRASYCRKFGFKAAVTAAFGVMTSCYAYRCTLDGYYIQGSNETLPSEGNNTRGIRMIGCLSEEAGYNVDTYYPGFDTAGFRCDQGGDYPTWPRNVQMVSCHAFGGSKMKVAFRNSVDPYLGPDRNKLINCTASDFTQLASDGFVEPWSLIGMNTSQSIPSNTDTAIVWGHVLNGQDGFGFLTGGGTATLTFPYACRISVVANVAWDAAADGVRVSTVFINGSRVPGQRDVRPADVDNSSTPNLAFEWNVAAGDTLQVIVSQTSSGAVDVNGSDTTLSITDMTYAQQLVVVI